MQIFLRLPTALGSVVKVIGLREKRPKNAKSVMKSPTGRYSYRQDVMAITKTRKVRDVFCMASRRSAMTCPESLTNKPGHKQTSRKGRQPGSMFPTFTNRTDCFCGSVS